MQCNWSDWCEKDKYYIFELLYFFFFCQLYKATAMKQNFSQIHNEKVQIKQER